MDSSQLIQESHADITINRRLAIPLSELRFHFSRSGGPGGQNVNRRETRVELLFDLQHSASLSAPQRERLLQRLSGQLDSDGILRIVVTSERSQLRNRQEAIARFALFLRDALRVPKRRVATKPSMRTIARRVESKRKRSLLKEKRRRVGLAEAD